MGEGRREKEEEERDLQDRKTRIEKGKENGRGKIKN